MSNLNTVKPGTIRIIRVDGTVEEFDRTPRLAELHTLLHPPQGFDAVNLRNGCVMMVDDTGMVDDKPANPKATELYHAVCIPGTVHQIHGDVAIVRDSDFA